MNSNLLLATIWLSTAGALAQPVPNLGPGAGPGAERQAARAQRRVDLRTALQSNRLPDVQTARIYDLPSASRRLSVPELAEMRQQLRRQQSEVALLRP